MAKGYMETASAATPDRDALVTFKALLYAIGCIQSLPKDQQERSDMVHMCAIARRFNAPLSVMLWSVEHHIGHKIDLWPAHGGDEPAGLYSDQEIDTRDTVRAWIDERAAQFQRTLAATDAPPSNVVTFIGGPGDEGEAA